MKITSKRYEKVRFDSLQFGEVYMFNDNFYIKAKVINQHVNTVRLTDGFFTHHDDGLLVNKVDCELIIE